jgi:photosystem II stability/assembly factor-like uncharacterized protein
MIFSKKIINQSTVRLTLRLIFFFFLVFSLRSKADEPFWELVSMNPQRGMIYLFDRFDKDSIIFSSGSGGIFYSLDQGDNWNWFLDKNRVGIIKFGELIFTRGSDDLNGIQSYGIYKTTDFGKNWIDITGNWDRKYPPYKFVLDSNRIYTVLFNGTSNDQVFYTSDGGINWIFCTELDYKGDVWAYNNFLPHKNLLIATGETSDRKNSFFSISADTGKTWKRKDFKNNKIYGLVLISENEYFISTERDGIYYTSDYGDTWSSKWLKGESVNSFSISSDRKKIIAAIYEKGIRFSIDGGINWTQSASFSDINIRNLTMQVDKIINDYSFCFPFHLGSYRASDNFNIWQEKNNGYTGMSPYDFTFNKDTIVMSCCGVFKSIDKGKNFNYLDLKAYDTGPVAVNSKGVIFVGDQSTGGTEKGIFRSTDGGKNWESLYNNQGPPAILINKRDVLFIGGVSTDNGNTWNASPSNIDKIGINDEGDLFTFAWENPGDTMAGIWRSTDDGATWNKLQTETFGFIDPTITQRGGRVVFNSKTKTAFWEAGFNNEHSFGGGYKTTDNGRTWYAINYEKTGYPESIGIAVDSLGCWIGIGGATQGWGIYRSCDNGETWQRMDTTGLKHKEFGPIGVSPDGHIYVFGATGGLYRSRDKFVSVEEKPDPNDKITIKPNPAFDFIEVLNPNYEKISIINILGETIFQTSEFSKIDISSFPTGIYLVRIGDKVSKFVKL